MSKKELEAFGNVMYKPKKHKVVKCDVIARMLVKINEKKKTKIICEFTHWDCPLP